jgi:hypothetical protein
VLLLLCVPRRGVRESGIKSQGKKRRRQRRGHSPHQKKKPGSLSPCIGSRIVVIQCSDSLSNLWWLCTIRSFFPQVESAKKVLLSALSFFPLTFPTGTVTVVVNLPFSFEVYHYSFRFRSSAPICSKTILVSKVKVNV